MIKLKKSNFFKCVALFLVLLFAAQDKIYLSFSDQGSTNAELKAQLEMAKEEFKFEYYNEARSRIQRLIALLDPSSDAEKSLLKEANTLLKRIDNSIEKESRPPRKKRSAKWIWGVLAIGAVIAAVVIIPKMLKKFTLSVNRGIGVNGEPATGTYKIKKGKSQDYHYSAQSGYGSLSVKIDGVDAPVSGSIKMDKDHTLTASAVKEYKLTVNRGVGVTGYPASGTYYYLDGAQVDYIYSADTNYFNLQVTLDGSNIPASGKITMNQDHTLNASVVSGGNLQVSSNPTYSNIWLDNVLNPNRTLYTFTNLQPRMYNVKIRNFGYACGEQNITVYSGQTAYVYLALTNIKYGTELVVDDYNSVKGYVNGTSTVAWYWFYIKEPKTLTIDTYANAEEPVLDNYMELYGVDNRTFFLEGDDDDGTDSYARIIYNFSTPGNYFVKIRGYSNHAGYFRIRVFTGSPSSANNGLEPGSPFKK